MESSRRRNAAWKLPHAGHVALALAVLGPGAVATATAQAVRPSTVCLLAAAEVSVQRTREFTLPELARQGFVEGRNLNVVVRQGGGRSDALPRLAAELATQSCDVVITVSAAAVTAARQAMPSTPIVMGFADEPVARGFARSMHKPGGFITGISMQSHEVNLKRLQVVRELLPGVRRLGVLVIPTYVPEQRRGLEDAVARLGMEPVVAEAAGRADFDKAFARFREARVGAVPVASSPVFLAGVDRLVQLANEARLPLVCEWDEMAEAGCLASFGSVVGELRTRVGDYVARILRGQRPADMPIEQPTRFELVINAGVARRLGVQLPPTALARADRMME